MITKGSDPSRMKIEAIPPNKIVQYSEVMVEFRMRAI